MFKLFFFACVMAVAAAKPSIITTSPVAYAAYSPIAAYSAPITYSAYSEPIVTYSAYSYAPDDVYYLRR